MSRPPEEIVHLAWPDGSICCRMTQVVLILEDPRLWLAVPQGLRCPDCDLIYAEDHLHGLN